MLAWNRLQGYGRRAERVDIQRSAREKAVKDKTGWRLINIVTPPANHQTTIIRDQQADVRSGRSSNAMKAAGHHESSPAHRPGYFDIACTSDLRPAAHYTMQGQSDRAVRRAGKYDAKFPTAAHVPIKTAMANKWPILVPSPGTGEG